MQKMFFEALAGQSFLNCFGNSLKTLAFLNGVAGYY
jgi:hypothetical protein